CPVSADDDAEEHDEGEGIEEHRWVRESRRDYRKSHDHALGRAARKGVADRLWGNAGGRRRKLQGPRSKLQRETKVQRWGRAGRLWRGRRWGLFFSSGRTTQAMRRAAVVAAARSQSHQREIRNQGLGSGVAGM